MKKDSQFFLKKDSACINLSGITFRRYFKSSRTLKKIENKRSGEFINEELRYLFKETRYVMKEQPSFFPYLIIKDITKIGGVLIGILK